MYNYSKKLNFFNHLTCALKEISATDRRTTTQKYKKNKKSGSTAASARESDHKNGEAEGKHFIHFLNFLGHI
jgi:hypothetical protein